MSTVRNDAIILVWAVAAAAIYCVAPTTVSYVTLEVGIAAGLLVATRKSCAVSPARLLIRLIAGILAMGAVGFASGYFGSVLLVPEANDGPLTGYFIFGPVGLLIGFGAAVFGSTHGLKAWRYFAFMFSVAVALIAAVSFLFVTHRRA